eukprot:UN23538
MKKTRLDSAVLIEWTKGFATTGVAGEDVCYLLQKALEKHNVPVRVTAIVNDTTATLLTGKLQRTDCEIGVILGTGSNACFMGPNGVINTEWGGFDCDYLREKICTDTDHEIDKHSPNPNRQRYEKMVSGFYLGECARLELIKKLGLKRVASFQNEEVLRVNG